jgi:Lon protease-like protein
MRELHLFPLRTVLFPDGLLPLKIFEQRYLELTKVCIRDSAPFGVCLIREGGEVGAPALPHQVGCTARITDWEMPHLGMFHLLCRGEAVFRVVEHWAGKNGLISAVIEEREPPAPERLPDTYGELGGLLGKIIDKVGTDNFPAPILLDDAQWVGCRLAEALPLEPEFKQQLLETTQPLERLAILQDLLKDKSVTIGNT